MKNIILENKKYVKAVIRKFLGRDDDDLEQQIYIKTWQNMANYKPQGKFKQWICTIAANVCRDYFRSKTYHQSKAEISSDEVLANVSVKSAAEERIDRKKRQKIVLKAVDELPKIYREVIVLSSFEEYSIEQISKRLKIPEGTVKSRLHHARETLKTNLTFLLGENQ